MDAPGGRSQVGIGTLIVFIATVIVEMLATGVLIEARAFLQEQSEAPGEASSQRATDRVEVRHATATHSGGSMDSIEIDVAKAPLAGDIDISELVIHWFDSGGSSESTSSTFNVTAPRGTATVLEADSALLRITDLGQTIPDGEQATLRVVTAAGGTTCIFLRSPAAPPSDGSVCLRRASPGGNPAGASASSQTLEWAGASIDWNQDSCCLGSDNQPNDVMVGSNGFIYNSTGMNDG